MPNNCAITEKAIFEATWLEGDGTVLTDS